MGTSGMHVVHSTAIVRMTTMSITAKYLLYQHDLVVQSVYTVSAFSTVAVTTSVQLNITE